MKTKQYIKLPEISNQKIRQKYYTATSISHPAKANIPMMHWILKNFVQDGDVVLDPMAGIFTTGVEGMRLFPNSLFIGVELEDKFVKMARANIKKVERIAKKDMFLKIGKSTAVQGDARELEKVLKDKVSKIITSPPYAERYAYKDPEKEQKNDPYASKRNRIHKPYSQNPNNIGNLNYGTADKIISSPPFGQAQSGGGIAKKGYDGPKHTPTDLVGKRSYMPENVGSKENISNLPYGQADKVITSPPYSEKHEPFISKSYLKIRKETGRNTNRPSQKYVPYSQNQDNIGNLKHGKIDKIVSSPPYSKDVEPHIEMRPGSKKESMRGYIDKVISSPPYEEGIGQGSDSYSKSKTNIGSLTGKTYLGEMLRVYKECYKVLKPAGLMILITKDFIRNKNRVRLGEDTIKLSEAAGFTFKEIYYRKIEHPSFWRVLYQQKYPEVEKIDSEDILVFEKTASPQAIEER